METEDNNKNVASFGTLVLRCLAKAKIG